MSKIKLQETLAQIDRNLYIWSAKTLCDHFCKEQIGITYKSLANIGITPDKPYRNKYCTIRKGILLTAPKALSDNTAE